MKRLVIVLVVAMTAVACSASPVSTPAGEAAPGGPSGDGTPLSPVPTTAPTGAPATSVTTPPGVPSTTAPPTTTAPSSPVPAATAGAVLPVGGTVRADAVWVGPGGDDRSAGDRSRPLATVAEAVRRVAPVSGQVVVRGGTYHEGGIMVPPGSAVDITAAPSELPTFDGSRVLTGTWQPVGATVAQAYRPTGSPLGSGLYDGAAFANPAAPFADQVWAGGRRLRQVLSPAAVVPGTFYVDAAAGRIHLAPADSTGEVRVSDLGRFITISGSGSSLRGLRVTRYSPTLADNGVVRVEGPTAAPGVRGVTLEDLEVVDAATLAVSVLSAEILGHPREVGGLLSDITLRRVTVTGANWMGVAANWTDRLLLDRVRITRSNGAGEFRFSPQSGALKTSRVRDVRVVDSVIADNNSHGLWFDQSTVDATVERTRVTGSSGAGVFFEISDGLRLVDSVVAAPPWGTSNAVKVAGGSRVELDGNMISGGRDPLGIYTDVRSVPGCSDPDLPLCPWSYGSDRDDVRALPPTLDWIPQVESVVDNVIANPTTVGYCGGTTAVCVTAANGTTTVESSDIFDGSVIDGNTVVLGQQVLDGDAVLAGAIAGA